ncbi:MAG: T9SS type A sorting domain-containing protein [Bacteroidales bacterium]|nr:T9SS type A sorting domain-containing protein [Bacteroidales bacterium]
MQRYVVVRWPPFVPPFPAPWIIDDGWQEHEGRAWQWLFPILTPNPDTNNYVPDDSTQTDVQLAAWERYVAVQPNPATDKATVLSSVGLKGVEVFDMSGNRVLRLEASGLSAKLDVGTLPRGTYIVRVQTPIGTTARKLLLK